MSCDLLLLAAFHPELAPLRATLGDGLSANVRGVDVVARVVGIGLPMAAAGAAMQLAEVKPRGVILLGTCGAYAGTGIAVGTVVAARRVRLVELAVVDGWAQFPDPMSVLTGTHTALTDALVRSGAVAVDLATTLAITTDDVAAARMARGASVTTEHLEAHGVATACAARGVPFATALGVANLVGSRARDEWRAHHRGAAAAAVDAVLRALNDLASCLPRAPR